MARFSLGFGGGGSGGGVLGDLGTSIAAAMSPYRGEGFGGGVRAFLDPGPTQAVATRQRQRTLAALSPAIEQSQGFMRQAFRTLEAGDLNGGLQALAKGRAILQQNGVAEDDFSMKIFATLGENYRALHRKNAELDPSGIGKRFH